MPISRLSQQVSLTLKPRQSYRFLNVIRAEPTDHALSLAARQVADDLVVIDRGRRRDVIAFQAGAKELPGVQTDAEILVLGDDRLLLVAATRMDTCRAAFQFHRPGVGRPGYEGRPWDPLLQIGIADPAATEACLPRQGGRSIGRGRRVGSGCLDAAARQTRGEVRSLPASRLFGSRGQPCRPSPGLQTSCHQDDEPGARDEVSLAHHGDRAPARKNGRQINSGLRPARQPSPHREPDRPRECKLDKLGRLEPGQALSDHPRTARRIRPAGRSAL